MWKFLSEFFLWTYVRFQKVIRQESVFVCGVPSFKTCVNNNNIRVNFLLSSLVQLKQTEDNKVSILFLEFFLYVFVYGWMLHVVNETRDESSLVYRSFILFDTGVKSISV